MPLHRQPGRLKVIDLKNSVARGEYKVDSRRVAETIVDKFRIVGRVRALLIGPDGEGSRPDRSQAWSPERAAFERHQ